MAKKRKKQTQPKIKVVAAQYRKKYFHRLEQICNAIHPDIYKSLSSTEIALIYGYRGTHIRALGREKVPGFISRYCEDFIRENLKTHYIDIIPGQLKLTAQEYTFYVIPLENLMSAAKHLHGDTEWYVHLAEESRLRRFTDYYNLLETVAASLMYLLSHPAYSLCYVECEFKVEETNSRTGLSQIFWISGYTPEKVHIMYDDGKNRTGIRLTYNIPKALNEDKMEKFTQLSVAPSKFGAKWEGMDTPVPVFIQKHALERLDERLGCDVFGYVEQEVVKSMAEPVTYLAPNGMTLVEYRIKDIKAGYLVADVDENLIFIRTFLFLTNTSTPEGQKLREEIGLRKEDVKYLKLDKLDTLMNSDILKDEELCTILRNAGCESLLVLCEKLKDSDFWSHTAEEKKIADKLKNYIRQENWWDIGGDEAEEVIPENAEPEDLPDETSRTAE